jgi:hypothetical protein
MLKLYDATGWFTTYSTLPSVPSTSSGQSVKGGECAEPPLEYPPSLFSETFFSSNMGNQKVE